MTPTIAILGSDLQTLACAHTILDELPTTLIHIIVKEAEFGLMSGGPGLLERDSWPILPESWLSDFQFQQPGETSTAIRRSWLEKACAIHLTSRGTIFHLLSDCSITTKDNLITIQVKGGGHSNQQSILVDGVLNLRDEEMKHDLWEGGIRLGELKGEGIEGVRPDFLIETWWKGEEPTGVNWLQRMQWRGKDPRRSMSDDIHNGVTIARSFLEHNDAAETLRRGVKHATS